MSDGDACVLARHVTVTLQGCLEDCFSVFFKILSRYSAHVTYYFY